MCGVCPTSPATTIVNSRCSPGPMACATDCAGPGPAPPSSPPMSSSLLLGPPASLPRVLCVGGAWSSRACATCEGARVRACAHVCMCVCAHSAGARNKAPFAHSAEHWARPQAPPNHTHLHQQLVRGCARAHVALLAAQHELADLRARVRVCVRWCACVRWCWTARPRVNHFTTKRVCQPLATTRQ